MAKWLDGQMYKQLNKYLYVRKYFHLVICFYSSTLIHSLSIQLYFSDLFGFFLILSQIYSFLWHSCFDEVVLFDSMGMKTD